MPRSEPVSTSASELRRRAEERFEKRSAPERVDTEADARRLVHELAVHQIELEIQNEELKQSRHEVEGLLANYTQIFDFAPIGYFVLASDATIRGANLAAARLVGKERARLLGRRFTAMLPAAQLADWQAFLLHVLTTGYEESVSCELTLACEGAEPMQVRLTGSVLESSPVTALVAVEDVTARRRAESSLRDEGRRKDDFLAALSHELRNPLAALSYSLHTLDRAEPGSGAAREAETILRRQVGHLTALVDDLLDVTRIARGKIDLHLQPVELGELVRRTVEDHRASFEAHDVALALRRPPGEFWVDGDPNRLVQSLANLLGNALKFTGRSGHVAVNLTQEGGRAALAVSDDGAGIAPEVLPGLFTAFTQAPQTLDRARGGLGLGLAMVKGLVELHRGTVEIVSGGIGAGSTVTVRLPLRAAPAPDAPRKVPTKKPARRCRVLVIEDNRDVADSLRDLLELRGYESHVAYDGPTGLAQVRELHPEVVLCDIGLPGMDGYQVAREIRTHSDLGRTLLVAISGYGSPEDVRRATEAGYDRHVTKPPTIEKLETVIAEGHA